VDVVLGGLYVLVTPHVTERQRRLLAGAAAHGAPRRVVASNGVCGWACSAPHTSWSTPRSVGSCVAAAPDVHVTHQLAGALGVQGFQVGDDTARRLLKQHRYTLQRALKVLR
jgi:hypothetical protein